jgi:hypothetical protein
MTLQAGDKLNVAHGCVGNAGYSGSHLVSLAVQGRRSTRRPRCHVVMTVNAMSPMSSGSHAPWTSLIRFAATNSKSTPSNTNAPMPSRPQRRAPLQPRDVERTAGS